MVKLTVIDGRAQPSKLFDGKLRYPSDPPTWTATRKGLRLRVTQEPFPCNSRKASDWLFDDLYTNREIIFAIEAETDDRLVALGAFRNGARIGRLMMLMLVSHAWILFGSSPKPIQ